MTRRRTVLFVHSSDELYGSDRMLLLILKVLQTHQSSRLLVWLPALGQGDKPGPLGAILTDMGVEVDRVALPILRRAELTPRGMLGLIRRGWQLYLGFKKEKPLAIYLTTSAALPAAGLARVAGVRNTILHNQEIWQAGLERSTLGFMGLACAQIVSISEASHSSLTNRLRRRSTVVANAVEPLDGDSVTRVPARGSLRYLIASRWNGWKGHETLLDAWAQAEGPGTLTILGDAPSSGSKTDVEALVANHPFANTIDVVGQVPDISKYVDSSDVILIPSDRAEPFGLVAIEAFRAGRPVIASNAGGVAEVVTHGSDGWLFEPRNAEELAGIFKRLDRRQIIEASDMAAKTFRSLYTSESYAARYMTFWVSKVLVGDEL